MVDGAGGLAAHAIAATAAGGGAGEWPWPADDIVLRLGLLMVMLVPMAVSDMRSRSVDSALLYGMCGMGAVMFAYDFLTGRYHSAGPLVLAGASVSLAIGGLMLAAARIAGIMGYADGAAVLAAAAAIPAVGDLPVVPLAVAASCASGAVLMIGRSVWYNLADIVRGRSPAPNFLYRHNKRAGERFTVREATLDASEGDKQRIGWVDDDGTMRGEDGEEYFVAADAHGMPVANTVPMYALLCAGIAAACSFLLLTDFASVHVQRIVVDSGGLGAFLLDPGLSFGPRWG